MLACCSGSTAMKVLLATLFLSLLAIALPGRAQFAGHNTKGDMGLNAGSQAPPGLWVVPMVYAYSADTLRDGNGDRFAPLGGGGSIDTEAAVLGLLYTTEYKILGGSYGFSVWPSVTNNALGLPILPTDVGASTGLGDLYIQPMVLGWNTQRADFTAGLGVYAPVGEFDIEGDSNRGLGMWSYEIFGGTTLYLDEAKTWNLAALAAYETHGKKDGTDIRVGDILTIEGGLGKSFMDGSVNIGLAFYGQWKITDDDIGIALPPGSNVVNTSKFRVFGFGPEVTLPLASKAKLFGFLTLRYFWETGARSTLEGNTFLATFTLPVPSISLQ